MPRPSTKEDLLSASRDQYEQLNLLISQMNDTELNTPFDFSGDTKKKEAHWQRDRNLRDVLIHLYEWQRLLLGWVEANQLGEDKPFLPPPYNWRTYGKMNLAFWRQHQATPREEAARLLEGSHSQVMQLAEKFSNEELFSKGRYPWTGGSALGSYFVSVTSSHYDWAMKKLKAHRQNCRR